MASITVEIDIDHADLLLDLFCELIDSNVITAGASVTALTILSRIISESMEKQSGDWTPSFDPATF